MIHTSRDRIGVVGDWCRICDAETSREASRLCGSCQESQSRLELFLSHPAAREYARQLLSAYESRPAPTSEPGYKQTAWQDAVQAQAKALADTYREALETFLREELTRIGVTDPAIAAQSGFEVQVQSYNDGGAMWELRQWGKYVAHRFYP